METNGKENAIRCRHSLDRGAVDGLKRILTNLPSRVPTLLGDLKIPPTDFDLYFNAAIQSIRGTSAATTKQKRGFLESLLNLLGESKTIRNWEFVGTKGRQDYKVVLLNDRLVCVEAKGCPDGNNMNIWERPAWADEFIVWSQCPMSLEKQPGEGVWSGIATRLLTKMAVERQQVDAFVFYDARCGSQQRRCWKQYGLLGVRTTATDIVGQDDRNWLPPPCIYLFPRTIPNPRTNRRPPLHSFETCQFATTLLRGFKVPRSAWPQYTHWATIELRQDVKAIYKRIEIGHELGKPPVITGTWTKLKRESP